MNLELEGRTCMVSGASAGIGAGIVRTLAKLGVRVGATARRLDRIEALVESVVAEGGVRPLALACNITDAADVAHLVDEALARLGKVDILINCAGGSRPTTTEADDAFWDEAFALNFTAARRLTTALLPGMRQRRWGRILNISGSMEPRGLNAAMAAKAALHLWAKGLACDVAAEA